MHKRAVLILISILLFTACVNIEKAAVVDFESQNIAPTELAHFLDSLSTLVSSKNSYLLISQETINELLANDPGCLESDCVADTGKLLKADCIFTGRLVLDDEKYKLRLDKVDVASGKTVQTGSYSADSLENLINKISL